MKLNKKHLIWILPLIGVFCLALLQLLWPNNIPRPFLYIDNRPLGLVSGEDMVKIIQNRFNDSRIILSLENKNTEIELAKVGAVPNSDSIKKLYTYNFIDRLISLSILASLKVDNISLDFDKTVSKKFMQEYAKSSEYNYKNANIYMDNFGSIKITPAQKGLKIDQDKLLNIFFEQKLYMSGKNTVKVPSIEITPKINDKYYTKYVNMINNYATKGVVLINKNKNIYDRFYYPIKKDIVSWFSIDSKDNENFLTINEDNFKKYVNYLNSELEYEGINTVIDILDGREKSRINGEKGYRVSYEKMKNTILKGAYEGINRYIIEYEETEPKEKKNYSYTNTQAGLQAKIEDLGKQYNIRVSLKQMDGAKWEANYRDIESTPSASTYKLYIALKIFEHMDKGDISWQTPILGVDTKECFRRMIQVSTNACAEEWIQGFGRNNINQYIYSLGISTTTTFLSYDAVRTTAKDLRNTVEGIYSGNFIKSEKNRLALLNAMNKQQWRSGIPSGSSGKVYDKVGFLWDYSHDVAVVEHPRGTYILAIMTKGASFHTIANITRELEAVMYP